jgi:hypothetical protein
VEKLAVVNFYDRILPNDNTKPLDSDYYPSEVLFAKRLRELNPKVVLLLGEHGTYSLTPTNVKRDIPQGERTYLAVPRSP